MADQASVDFFISRNSADRAWAEWIGWVLESARYRVILQDWDFRAGSNFVHQMQDASSRAAQTVCVLSPAWLGAEYSQSEWYAAYARDPLGIAHRVLPVRVIECEPDGLLKPIVYIDLVGLDRDTAADRLLSRVREGRAKPTSEPPFPGPASPAHQHRPAEQEPAFPGTQPDSVAVQPSQHWTVEGIVWDTLRALQATNSQVTIGSLYEAVEAIKFMYIRRVSIVPTLMEMRKRGMLEWNRKDIHDLAEDAVIEINPECADRQID